MNTSAANASSASPPCRPAPGRISNCLQVAPSPAPIERVIRAADALRDRLKVASAPLRTRRARPAGDLALTRYELRDVAKQYGAAANRRVRDQHRIAELAVVLEDAATSFADALPGTESLAAEVLPNHAARAA